MGASEFAVTVVICTFNRFDVLKDAIMSIESQDFPTDTFELLIVDNSSDLSASRSFSEAIDISCPFRLIRESTPGLSRARNIGVREARSPVVAFIDDDAIAAPDWISNIYENFKLNANTGIVGGPVRPIWSTGRPPWLHPWLEGFLTVVDRGAHRKILSSAEWLAGTNIAFRRDLLIKVGMFNENLGRIGRLLLSNEELLVSDAIRDLGFDIIYEPAAIVDHKVHADRVSQNWMRRRAVWQALSDMIMSPSKEIEFESEVECVLAFLNKRTPANRNLVGLFMDIEDAEAFYEQTRALNSLIKLMTTDGNDWRKYLAAARD